MKKSLVYVSLIAIALLVVAGFSKADDANWSTDYTKALAQAKAGKKIVLLDFTGSDWCPWCQKLDKEVFAQPKFQEFAKKNLILVEVDFPQNKPQSSEVKKQNADLQDKYNIQGYPTVIVLDSNGNKLGELGYEPGGPDTFLADLAKLTKS